MPFRSFFPKDSFRSTTRTFVRGLSSAAFVAFVGFSATAQAQRIVPNAPNFSQNASIPQRAPQNAEQNPPISQRVPRQASDATAIWSNFLFGSPANAQTPRRRSPMKFAFSPENAPKSQSARQASNNRRADDQTRPNSIDASNSGALSQTPATTQSSPIRQTPTTEATAEARRRRLQELNALLAARRPDEFARRLALSTSADQTPQLARQEQLNAVESTSPAATASTARLADLRRVGADGDAANRPNESAAASVSFDAARANRSKIRQASGVVPAEEIVALPTVDEFADDALGFAFLPIRPNALQIAPQIFLSSEIVSLPTAAALEPEPTAEPKSTPLPEPLEARPNVDASTPPTAIQPLESATPAPERETRRQAVDVDASKSVAKPTFASPAKSTDSIRTTNFTVSDEKFPLHRPASPFVDSRTVPDKN